MRKTPNGFMVRAIAGLAIALGAAQAYAQTSLGVSVKTYGTTTRIPCYDYNNYVPAIDSPVVGGWYGPSRRVGVVTNNVCDTNSICTIESASDLLAGNGARFGRACAGRVYVRSAGWNDVSGCPPNTATIETMNYVRSDGSTYDGYMTLCVKTDTYQ